MGKYDNEAKTILGFAFTILCTAASEDKIDGQKMEDISLKLHPAVGGRHRKRGGKSDDAEMRNVISDWYELGGLCELNHGEALGKLVDILEDTTVNLRPIAKELKHVISKSKENQTILPVQSSKGGSVDETVPLVDNRNCNAETSLNQTGNIENHLFTTYLPPV